MAVRRHFNALGQMRIDVPHLRSIESSINFDFDTFAGDIMAGNQPYVIRSFALDMTNALGNPAVNLQLVVAGGALVHPLASEAGSIFTVEVGTDPEVLETTNARIEGGFTSNALNYIGIDLRRTADESTSDLVMFLDANTKLETPRTIPLGRILDYVIVIGTQDFSATPHVCPIAIVEVALDGTVDSIEDARQMMLRLGTGGTSPDRAYTYPWLDGRKEATSGDDIFIGGDKNIDSLKGWLDAAMTRLWEVGGGEYWYSGTTDREVKLAFGAPVLANGDNFDWTATPILEWASLKLLFANSTATYNDIADGSLTIANDECIYVDCDRTTNRTGGTALVPVVANRITLGQPTVPGSRVVIAWRKGTEVFIKDKQYEAGRLYAPVAAPLVTGTVKLSYAAGTPLDPVVNPIGVNGVWSNTATAGTTVGVTGTGFGAAAGVAGVGGTGGIGTTGAGSGAATGVQGTGGATGAGVTGIGGTTSGAGGVFTGKGGANGVTSTGQGAGAGVNAEGGATGTGGVFKGGTTSGAGVFSTGVGVSSGVTAKGGDISGYGIVATGGTGSGNGVRGVGGPAAGVGTGGYGGEFQVTEAGFGILSTGGATNAAGVRGVGGGTTGLGGSFQGASSGNGLTATGGATVGAGVVGQGGPASIGVQGTGGTTGAGVAGVGGATAGSIGVTGTSNATNGHGVQGTGTGTGTGVIGIAGSAGLAGLFNTTAAAIGGVQVIGQGTAALAINSPHDVLQLRNSTNTNASKLMLSMLHQDATSARDGWVIHTNRVADSDVDWCLASVVNGTITNRLNFDLSTLEFSPTSSSPRIALGASGSPWGQAHVQGIRYASTTFALSSMGATLAINGFTFIRVTSSLGSHTISDITGGEDGQIIHLFSQGVTGWTLDPGARINLSTLGAMSMTQNDIITLIYNEADTCWHEISRSVN